MSILPTKATDMIDQIHQTLTLDSLLTERLTLLHSLRKENNVSIIIHLLPYALSDDPQLALEAKQTIHQIYSNAKLESLIGLDQSIREIRNQILSHFDKWNKIDPSKLDSISLLHNHDFTWLGLLCSHHNGFIREKAIRKLAEIESDRIIPFLLIRLNDWVDQVQSIAINAVKSKLNPKYMSGFLQSIYLVNHLTQYRRTDFHWLYDKIHSLLTQTNNLQLLTKSLYSKDKYVRRFSLNLCLQSTRLNQDKLLPSLLSHKDPIMRLKASKYIRTNLDDQDQIKWLPILLQDRFMPVRREGFFIQYNRLSNIMDKLKMGLFDSHPTIRELSRFYTKKYTQMDIPSLYRTELADTTSPYLATSIIGLGETGRKSDCLLIEPYLKHPMISVRKNAWRALSYLDFETYQLSFIEALGDSSSGVSKTAKKALEKRNNSLYLKELWKVFEEAVISNRPDVQKKVVSLFTTVNRVDQMIYYLKVMRSTSDLFILQMAQLHLLHLLSGIGIRFYLSLQPYEVELIQQELSRKTETLDPSIVKHIQFIIHTYTL